MYVLKFDENHNIPMKQVFYVSAITKNVLASPLKLTNELGR